MAEKLGFSVIDMVISALSDAGHNNQTALEVMILSTNSSVLVEFRQKTKFKLVYKIDESIRDAVASSIVEIKEFADAVAIDRQSVYPVTQQFTTRQTDVVSKLQNAGIAVYVYLFQNEFVAQPWDFFSDATVEINTYVQGAGVDGIITDFPATASAYKSMCTLSSFLVVLHMMIEHILVELIGHGNLLMTCFTNNSAMLFIYLKYDQQELNVATTLNLQEILAGKWGRMHQVT